MFHHVSLHAASLRLKISNCSEVCQVFCSMQSPSSQEEGEQKHCHLDHTGRKYEKFCHHCVAWITTVKYAKIWFASTSKHIPNLAAPFAHRRKTARSGETVISDLTHKDRWWNLSFSASAPKHLLKNAQLATTAGSSRMFKTVVVYQKDRGFRNSSLCWLHRLSCGASAILKTNGSKSGNRLAFQGWLDDSLGSPCQSHFSWII